MRPTPSFRPKFPRSSTTPRSAVQPPPVNQAPPQSFPGQPPQSSASPQPSQPYDFITNPPSPQRPSLLGNSSLPIRIALISGGLLVLLIKSLIGGNSNLPLFVTVAEDQQEMVHLATNAALQKDLSVNNQNFAATAKTSLSSTQSQVITYLDSNHVKVKAKALNRKLSLATDKQLTAAAAATTYNQTFQEVMNTQLNGYVTDLKQAFKLTKGQKGHALLNDSYDQAQLLLKQLNTPNGS
jgi:hypothetical protein